MRLKQVVKDVVRLVRGTLPESIQVRSAAAARSDRILGDPVQINQVLMNLCTNAGHAMKASGGVLSIALDDFAKAEGDPAEPGLPAGQYVCLSVRDTGHGMDAKTMERIFEPFYTTKPAGEGTGLGLAVCHGIVRSHGGEITVASRPGEGAVFAVYLPVADPADGKES